MNSWRRPSLFHSRTAWVTTVSKTVPIVMFLSS
nr:MAG TPA: hypothetical protein [Caudoviricetes sp.]